MNRKYIAFALNCAALVCGIVGIVVRLVRNVDDFFLYYTQLSNVAAVISSAIYIIFSRSGNEKTQKFVRCMRYLGACGLGMTFAVVMFIFLPVGGEDAYRRLMCSVNGVLHHAVCPVLSVVSYVFFEVYEHELFELVIWFLSLMALVAGIGFAVRAANLAAAKRRGG